MKKYFDFVSFVGKLKNIERFKGQFFWRDYPPPPRWESVAEHTWRLGLFIMLMAPKLQKKIDLGHALQIALVHDMPEIIAGDYSPLGVDGTGKETHAFNLKAKKQKAKIEEKAAKKLFSKIGADGKRFFRLWKEYVNQETHEAKIVKAIDHLEAGVQYWDYRHGHVFPDHFKFSHAYNARGAEIDPSLLKFAKVMHDRDTKDYKEFVKKKS